jgi:hypothetical protein
VFRARSTVFATLIIQILLYAWELKSCEYSSQEAPADSSDMCIVDRSLFSLTPGRPFYKDLWANQVLFWSVLGGMVSVVLRKWHRIFLNDERDAENLSQQSTSLASITACSTKLQLDGNGALLLACPLFSSSGVKSGRLSASLCTEDGHHLQSKSITMNHLGQALSPARRTRTRRFKNSTPVYFPVFISRSPTPLPHEPILGHFYRYPLIPVY